MFIGAQPQTAWLGDQLAIDDHGFLLSGGEAASLADPSYRPLPVETNRAGVFAVGDVRHGSVKRVASESRRWHGHPHGARATGRLTMRDRGRTT